MFIIFLTASITPPYTVKAYFQPDMLRKCGKSLKGYVRMIKTAIVMGSASDREIALEAVETLGSFGVETIVRVLSAHRTPLEAYTFAQSLEAQGVGVVIAFAGMAAHLAGAVAAHTILPVIGVPVCSGGLGGMDALLSTVQMPSGIPVAAVAVNGAKNAALLAVEILALQDAQLREKLRNERCRMHDKVLQADEALQQEIQEKQGRV